MCQTHTVTSTALCRGAGFTRAFTASSAGIYCIFIYLNFMQHNAYIGELNALGILYQSSKGDEEITWQVHS